MLSGTQATLVRILRTGEPEIEAWEPLGKAASIEQVALLAARRSGIPIDESWLIEQQLVHDARLYWMRRILDRFDAAGVKAVPLKGPVFAERFYDPPYARVSLDLDIVVLPTQVPPAMRELERLGYSPDPHRFVAMDQHLELHHETAPEVELHYRLISEFGANQGVRDFVGRARVIEIQNLGAVNVPEAEDEFVFLCAHAAKHRFRPLRLLYDLFLLLERTPLDLELVWHRAGSMRVRTLLAMTVVVLRRDWDLPLHGIPIPEAALRRAERILPRFTRPRPRAGTKVELAGQYAADMIACDDLAARLRCCWRLGASFAKRVVKENFP
jgi:hypothetical protein